MCLLYCVVSLFPESGGQSFDTGLLNAVEVTAVYRKKPAKEDTGQYSTSVGDAICMSVYIYFDIYICI